MLFGKILLSLFPCLFCLLVILNFMSASLFDDGLPSLLPILFELFVFFSLGLDVFGPILFEIGHLLV
jgi:hypothetical protein